MAATAEEMAPTAEVGLEEEVAVETTYGELWNAMADPVEGTSMDIYGRLTHSCGLY